MFGKDKVRNKNCLEVLKLQKGLGLKWSGLGLGLRSKLGKALTLWVGMSRIRLTIGPKSLAINTRLNPKDKS